MHQVPPLFKAPYSIQTVPSRRIDRIRFSWFVVGVAFGALLSFLASQSDTYETVKSGATQIKNVFAREWERPAQKFAAAPGDNDAEANTLPLSVEMEVQRGDTLLTMLTDSNVAYDEAVDVVKAVKKVYNPRSLNIGQNLSLNLGKSDKGEGVATVSELAIAVSPLKTIKLTRTSGGDFKVTKIEAPVEKKLARSGGVITSSLYETGIQSGIPANLLGEIINAFSYDVDFQRDIKDGDKLDVLYEKMETSDGIGAGAGNLVYAALTIKGKELTIYRYADKSGNTGFYNALGESIRKALLKTPINGARITSGFGMRRHPLLGYSKMHKGVDFGAPTGTPIYAAGDGVVKFAGRKGGYGNYLQIGHNNKYATAYGHISRFASGITEGKRVRQGQVVAYVGSTGRSTGPHLHFEVIQNGSPINPAGLKLKTGDKLEGKAFASFKQQLGTVQMALNSLPMGGKIQVASAK